MGFARILGVSTLTLIASMVINYFVSFQLINEIFTTTYSSYNQLGYFTSIIESYFNYTSIPVLVTIVTVHFTGGLIYRKKDSYKIGLASTLIATFILFLILYKYTPTRWIQLFQTENPLIYTYLLNLLITITLTSLSSAFNGVALKLLEKTRKEQEANIQVKFKPQKCPKCKQIYKSNPLICSNCGYHFKKSQNSNHN